MALRVQAGASELTSKAFERSANAFEALVRNGDPEAPDRGFRRIIAAAAYRLAGFSAVAYSLFNETTDDLNASPGEAAIRHLILRDLGQLRGFVREWLDDEAHSDEQVADALWGEELEAAQRSTDVTDDLVVVLPTSAGKTRVAEIAALMTLSLARRVLIVTPLRALSAQTERSFRKTFAPLGFTVSSLYGASGFLIGDEDALRTREIIIATPEKLDFALRTNPSLIDDVGLIVLDEGHMIGPSEREIRYETLVQRLLWRSDADERRIVCLSAILPSGNELDDLTAWIRSDEPGEPVLSEWRPTRQRFGALTWRGKDAMLRLDLDDNGPFLDKFVVQKPARGKEKKPYPRKNSHLALFAAWEFAGQGKRTLIFSTQANWVESYGKQVVDLCKRGYVAKRLAAGAQYDDDGDDDDDGGGEGTIDEEPLSQIVERLDSTVFGLIEALDADRADLPKLFQVEGDGYGMEWNGLVPTSPQIHCRIVEPARPRRFGTCLTDWIRADYGGKILRLTSSTKRSNMRHRTRLRRATPGTPPAPPAPAGSRVASGARCGPPPPCARRRSRRAAPRPPPRRPRPA